MKLGDAKVANASLISIPPNVDDPTVLRRVLTRITEQLDTVYGSRTSEDSAYVPQAQLTNSFNTLQQELAKAQQTNDEDLSAAVAKIQEQIEAINEQIQQLEQQIQQLDQRVGDLETTVGAGAGVNGTFTTNDGKTVTVADGIITSIV